jgi:endonuclease YncB( thermonuclease family)
MKFNYRTIATPTSSVALHLLLSLLMLVVCCIPRIAEADKLSKVINSSLIVLESGKKVKLASIITPYYLQLDKYEQHALDFLNRQLQDKDILLTEHSQDRYGNIVADVFVGDNYYIQEQMVSQGLAAVYNKQTNDDNFIKINQAENLARNEQLNIWQSNNMVVRNSDYIMQGDEGKFAIVSGTVKKVSVNKGVTYINFGDDWRNDFTVIVGKTNRRFLNDLFPLTGKSLIVKGVLEKYNGYAIKINNYGQVVAAG